MEDFEGVIAWPVRMDDGFKIVSSQIENAYDDGKPTYLATTDESYQIGEHIAANFWDGFYDGGTLEQIDDSKYRVSYMSPKAVSTTDYNEQEKMLVLAVKKGYIWHKHLICFKYETSNFDCYSSIN